MSTQYTCLRKSNIFINLVDDHMGQIEERLRNISLNKGQMLFSGHQPLQDIYIIRSGHIKIYSMMDGRESILEVLTEGDTFGSFSGDTTRKGLYAEAMDKASVCKLEQEQFRKLITTHPEIAVSIIEELTRRVDQAHQKLANITLGDAQSKVLTELQRLSKRLGTEQTDGYYSLDTKFSHQQIADMVGLSRESVSHSFGKLRKSGQLSTLNGELLIKIK